MIEQALQVSGLRKSYQEFTLNDVSFSLPKGYVMGLVGPNGSGKTTIIKLIMNLISPEAGEIKILGLDHRKEEAQARAQIGFVYDVMPFYADVSLRNTKRAIAPFYEKWNEALFQELASTFDLPLNKKVKKLSQGMRTKFALALALSHEAELLILDEPTTGLDPVFRRELLHGLSGLLQDEGKSVLFSTHITSDLERIADYVTFIRDGSVLLTETREELREVWGVVRGDESTVSALDRKYWRGARRAPHGMDVLTSNASVARQLLGDAVMVERASFEDIVVLLDGEAHHA
ncbi:MAG: ABC transporter ATP-binding protein [Gemmatimonadota bacterium]